MKYVASNIPKLWKKRMVEIQLSDNISSYCVLVTIYATLCPPSKLVEMSFQHSKEKKGPLIWPKRPKALRTRTSQFV